MNSPIPTAIADLSEGGIIAITFCLKPRSDITRNITPATNTPPSAVCQGNIPRAGRVLLADAVGTVVGALFGTSTVTSFTESLTGVAEGAKTGLANIFTSLGFLACMFLYPLVKMVGGGYQLSETVTLYPITGPILIIVGAMMATSFRDIEWKRYDEAIPAFLAMLGMPLTYSISNGLALGFISYAVIKPLVGKGKELHPIFYIVAAIFLAKYIFIGFSY